MTGLNFGFLLAGAVLTETVFAWPGLGRLMYDSIYTRDYPVLMGMFIFISIVRHPDQSGHGYFLFGPRPQNQDKVNVERVRDLWKKYRRNRAAVFGLYVVVFFMLLAILSPLIAPFYPLSIGKDSFHRPDSSYLMGTDDLGRDLFSGVLWGARVSIMVGLLAALTSTVIGVHHRGPGRLLRRAGR